MHNDACFELKIGVVLSCKFVFTVVQRVVLRAGSVQLQVRVERPASIESKYQNREPLEYVVTQMLAIKESYLHRNMYLGCHSSDSKLCSPRSRCVLRAVWPVFDGSVALF